MASVLSSQPRRVRVEGSNPKSIVRRNIVIRGIAEKLAEEHNLQQKTN